MNYRHAYHAGNFADVLKHAVTAAVMLRMQARPKPLSYVESHSGAGLYRLDAPEARRSREADNGILRLAEAAPRSAALAAYLRLVAALPENDAALRAYPGSPLLAAGLLGDDDRLVLVEAVPAEAEALNRLFRHDPRVAVHCRDGWEAIGALLPPVIFSPIRRPSAMALTDWSDAPPSLRRCARTPRPTAARCRRDS